MFLRRPVHPGPANLIAVFTGMRICWSGLLSAHVSMTDMRHRGELAGKSILSHTIGGFWAGIAAHWLFVLSFPL